MTLQELAAALASSADAQNIMIFPNGKAYLVTRHGGFPFETLEEVERGLSPSTPSQQKKEQKQT